MTVLDCVDQGPVLSAELARPKNITKRQEERCISKLTPYWSDEQLDQVIEMFQAHGLIWTCLSNCHQPIGCSRRLWLFWK